MYSKFSGNDSIILLKENQRPLGKKERILEGSLDLIPSLSHSVKIQIMGRKVCLRCKGKGVVNKLLKTKSLLTSHSIVENYYNSKTVEQKAMFTLYKLTVKLMLTLYNNIMKFQKKNCQIIAKCEHEFYSTLYKVCT